MQPTAEFAQHHDLEAPRIDGRSFRQAWRVQTRLNRLLVEGAITPQAWIAALIFRATWDTVFTGLWSVSRWEPAIASSRPTDDRLVNRLDALTALRRLRSNLGRRDYELIEVCIVDDISWSSLGRQLHVDPKTARTRTVTALRALGRRKWA
jgi:hypothetical protein